MTPTEDRSTARARRSERARERVTIHAENKPAVQTFSTFRCAEEGFLTPKSQGEISGCSWRASPFWNPIPNHPRTIWTKSLALNLFLLRAQKSHSIYLSYHGLPANEIVAVRRRPLRLDINANFLLAAAAAAAARIMKACARFGLWAVRFRSRSRRRRRRRWRRADISRTDAVRIWVA